MATDSRRLSILSGQEIEGLYGLPRFTEDDRQVFFDLSPVEREVVDAVHAISTAVQLTLQLGYFKARRQFFVYTREAVLDDLEHIRGRYFPAREIADIKALSKPTRLEQQRIILKLFDYQSCDHRAKLALEKKAQRAAALSTQPIFILREVLQYLAHQRIVAPGYTYLQDMIGRVVSGERQRITRFLAQALTPAIEKQLKPLLEADDGTYRISILKHEPKDFSYGELCQEVARRKFFHPLYEFGQTFLASAGLPNESVKYYASLVQFYTVYKLQRMAAITTQLYLLCFAYHRFRQINDNLIDAFIQLIDQYEKQAKLASVEAAQVALIEASKNLKAAGEVLNLFIDSSIPDSTPFSAVKKRAFSLLESGHFALVSNYMLNIEFDKTAFEWSFYGTLQHKFKLNLRHLFYSLDFAGMVEDAPLLDAIVFLQDLLRQGKSPRQVKPKEFPTAVIPKNLQRYMYTKASKRKDKQIEVDRYEFLVYRLLRNALEAGNVHVKDSNDFRSFEDDLISPERWKAKDTVLREIGAPILLAPIEQTLAAFREELDAQFERVNARIENGDNKHIRLTGSGEERRWSLIYPSEEEPINGPFYGQVPGIGIADLLWFVAGKTGFLDGFSHVLARYVKQTAEPRLILACIVAMVTRLPAFRQQLEAMCFAAVCLGTLADDMLRLVEIRITAIWTWGHRVVADKVMPARIRKKSEIVAAVRGLVADKTLTDSTFRAKVSALVLPEPSTVNRSRAADVREVLSRNARRIRPILQLLAKLHLLGDSLGGHGLSYLRGVYDDGADTFFIDRAPTWARRWKILIEESDSQSSCRAFEAATAWAARQGLRNGSLYSKYGFEYADPAGHLMPADVWKQRRGSYQLEKELPNTDHLYIERAQAALRASLAGLQEAVAAGDVWIGRKDLYFRRDEAEERPDGVDQAQIELYRQVGRIQLPTLLLELDAQVHFSWKLLGREPKNAEELLGVYGALLAAGTDLESRGVATLIRGVHESAIRRYMRLFEAEPALRAANDALLHFARSYAIVNHWGTGFEASSDLMSLDASKHLYDARVDPKRRVHGMGIYQTVLDQWGIPYDQPLPLMRRQVGAAIEGVVRQRVAPIKSLAVDTHGHTHFGSGQAKLLGFDLYTRWHDMRGQWVHVPKDWPEVPGLELVLKRDIDVDFIESERDDLLCMAASIHDGYGSATFLLERHGSAARQSKLH